METSDQVPRPQPGKTHLKLFAGAERTTNDLTPSPPPNPPPRAEAAAAAAPANRKAAARAAEDAWQAVEAAAAS